MRYRKLKDYAKLLEAVIEASSDIIIITDPRGNILVWNSGAKKFLKYQEKEMIGKNILKLIIDDQGKSNGGEIKKMLKEKQGIENHRCFYRRKDGSTEPVLLTVNLVRDDSGRIRRVVGIAKSIKCQLEAEAKLKRQNEELERLSMIDHLTDLCNRRFFDVKIEEEVNRALQLKYPLSLLFIDFDELKWVNDHFGHSAGDSALISIAKVILDSTKETTDVAARYGGDEFCIIAPGALRKNAIEMAERIRKKIKELKFQSGTTGFSITVSIGISELNQTINTAKKLINAADFAAKRAKREGKNKVLHIDDLNSTLVQI